MTMNDWFGEERPPTNCPTCGSPAPERYPVAQVVGEDEPCGDPWHGPALNDRQVAAQARWLARRGERLRDEAVERVSKHADPEWLKAGKAAAWAVANLHAEFTTDDIWLLIPGHLTTHDNRAMTAVTAYLKKEKLADLTSLVRPSIRPEAHRGPKRVWRSLVYVHPGTGG